MKKPLQLLPRIALSLVAALTFSSVTHAQFSPGAPVYEITPGMSKIAFYVKASVRLDGNFEKWNAALAFTSTDPSTGLLNIKIRADSVNTGSTRKDDKLKGKDCFDVEECPYITFQSTKIIQTGLHSFEFQGRLPCVASRRPRRLPSPLIGREKAQVRSKEPCGSIARISDWVAT